MDKKKVKELIEQILKYCDQAYSPYWRPKSFEEFIKLGNICREAIRELSKSDWVSVGDGLPEYGEEVWVRSKKFPKLVHTSYRIKDVNGLNVFDKNDFPLEYSVTHWKPIEKLEE